MKYIKYEQKDYIGIITINREKALNALNSDVLSELEETVDSISADDTRCVIITGAGQKSFVAGADIAQMCNETRAQAQAFSENGNNVFRKIEKLPMPVIAAVNGFALGGGCELSLSCDIRIASENALFGQPEAGLGITAGFGGTQRLARTIGVGKAKELLYTCSKIKADEALKTGLVNAVYPIDQLMDECMKLAGKIARNAPIAVRATKKAINLGLQTDIDSAIQIEAELHASCFESQDQKNAMTAFLEKRKHDPFMNK